MRGLLLVTALAAAVVLAACTQPAAPPTPTRAPAAPTKAAEPTKPAAPAAAPTKPAEATKAPAAPTSAPTAAPTAVPAKKVDFPQKGRAINFIIPWAAGSSSDLSARFMAAELEKELGGSVQPVNKAGASSQVGITELAMARPDGYTIGLTNMPTLPMTYMDPERKATFTMKSFVPIANYISEPYLIIVKGDSPFKTVKDVVDAAKAKPNEIKISTAGLKTNVHLQAHQFGKLAGVKFSFVHFDGGAPALTAVLGGHVDLNPAAPVVLLPQVKSGAVRALAVMDKEESKFFPGVPTMTSQGYKVDQATTRGLSAPAGTPKEIVDIMSNAVKKILSDPQIQKKMEDIALRPHFLDSAGYAAHWAENESTVGPLLKELSE